MTCRSNKAYEDPVIKILCIMPGNVMNNIHSNSLSIEIYNLKVPSPLAERGLPPVQPAMR